MQGAALLMHEHPDQPRDKHEISRPRDHVVHRKSKSYNKRKGNIDVELYGRTGDDLR